jgi:hypothetical protein
VLLRGDLVNALTFTFDLFLYVIALMVLALFVIACLGAVGIS